MRNLLFIIVLALTACGEFKELTKDLELGTSFGRIAEQELLNEIVYQVAPQFRGKNLKDLAGETCWALAEEDKTTHYVTTYVNEPDEFLTGYKKVDDCDDPLEIDLVVLDEKVKSVITDKNKRRRWLKDFVIDTGKKLLLLKLGVPVAKKEVTSERT